MEQISHRSTSSGNGVPACYGELMRLEIVDLFDLAVEACVDDVPDSCCGVRPPLLRNQSLDPEDCSSIHPTTRGGSTVVFNQVA